MYLGSAAKSKNMIETLGKIDNKDVNQKSFHAGLLKLMELAPVSIFATSLLFLSGAIYAHSDMEKKKPVHEYNELADNLTKELISALTASTKLLHQVSNGNIYTIAKARHEQLAKIIKSNPGEVLRLALNDELRSKLPADIKALVEEKVTLDGILKVRHIDMKVAADSYFAHALEMENNEVSLHFSKERTTVKTGARIRVSGVKLDNALAIGSSSAAEVSLLTAPSANQALSLGEQKTLVVMVNFADKVEQPWTKAFAEEVFFKTTSDYDRESSYGQTWLSGAVTNWITINRNHDRACTNSGDFDPSLISQAKSAASAAGYSVSDYRRLVYVITASNCGFMGVGDVGGEPTMALIHDKPNLGVVAHEMGHNLGLYHANSLDCGNQILGGTCKHIEYGDVFDIMGWSWFGHYNAFHKDLLGWLNTSNSPSVTTITSGNGQYNIDALSSPNSVNPKALKIRRTSSSPNTPEWFYVELRKPIGFDSYISNNSNLMNGVLIHKAITSELQSHLLDMTPATNSWEDPALTVGQQFTDPLTGIVIKLNSINGNTANVTVNYSSGGGETQVQITSSAGPNGSISPLGNVSVNKGGSQTFSITPAAGYAVDSVIVDGVNVGPVSSYTFLNVQAEHSINATFKSATSGGPNGYIWCANEGGVCTFSGKRAVAYGANRKFYYKKGVRKSVGCNNAVFGDPISGVYKACYYKQ